MDAWTKRHRKDWETRELLKLWEEMNQFERRAVLTVFRRMMALPVGNRVDVAEACMMLGCSKSTFERRLKDKVFRFTIQRDEKNGERFLFADEINLWINTVGTAEELWSALLELQREKNRLGALKKKKQKRS